MSQKTPQRPPGAPPAEIPTSSQRPAPGRRDGDGSVKRPPGPPPGPPPSKQNTSEAGAPNAAAPRKPPPPTAPPPSVKERGGRIQVMRPPPKGPPPPRPDPSAQAKAPVNPKGPPPAKPGGRPLPQGPPPTSAPSPEKKGVARAPVTDSPLIPTAPAPEAPLDPSKPEVPRSVAEGKGAAKPFRAPPGAPPGKPPPPSIAPPQPTGVKSNTARPPSTPYGAPPGRAPPTGLPPGQRPPPPSGKPPPSQSNAVPLLGHISDDSEDDDMQPEAPPPPSGPPPEDLDDEEALLPPSSEPPPPMEPPPSSTVVKVPPPTESRFARNLGSLDLSKLHPGRLTVKLVMGHGIRKAGQAAGRTKVDACVHAQLGSHKKAPKAKSRIHKKANDQPNFQEEVLTFDVLKVEDFVTDGDIICKLTLMDENTYSNATLGSMELSILQFMQASNRPVRDRFPLDPPEGQASAFKQALEMEVTYREAKVGMLLMTLYEGRELHNPDLVGKQDPYMVFHIGDKYTKKSAVVLDGGHHPYFKEEQLSMWVDRRNWVHDLTVEAWDQDVGADDLIGRTTLSLIELMNEAEHPDTQKEKLVELFSKKGDRSHGHLLARFQFLPAGQLAIKVMEGKGLRLVGDNRQDPFLSFTVDGVAVSITKKTQVDTDGGQDPSWDETLVLDVVDHYQLEVTAHDHDLLGEDTLIGRTSVSLLPVFKKGLVDSWLTLTAPNAGGREQPAGDVHVQFDFTGPRGVAYPQNQPGIDSFDETQRVQETLMKEKLREEAVKKGKESTAPAMLAMDVVVQADKPQSAPKDTTFSDSEIEAAFHFIDLDKNGYVGASEIRHLLVCMGELITDEEVDMMISMVDQDGDGQVSYAEFYELVTDPDPSRPDFGKKTLDDEPKGPKINPAEQMQRQRELQAKQEKRAMLSAFVKDNSIGVSEVRYAFDTFMGLPSEKRQDGIDFALFCKLMRVESTGEYHRLFTLFDADNSGDVDIKELILGLLNFVEISKDERCEFIFQAFDDDRSGSIDIEELISILSANHLQSRDAVRKKAETIMRQADAGGRGEITLAQFKLVSEKFPNILFPPSNK